MKNKASRRKVYRWGIVVFTCLGIIYSVSQTGSHGAVILFLIFGFIVFIPPAIWLWLRIDLDQPFRLSELSVLLVFSTVFFPNPWGLLSFPIALFLWLISRFCAKDSFSKRKNRLERCGPPASRYSGMRHST